jgi:hypothetical protein
VIRFFTVKGLKARAIHPELESVYGSEALTVPKVKKCQRRFHHGITDLFDDPRPGRPLTNDLGRAIGSVLEDRPFSSCKVRCRHFRIGKAMCLHILHDMLGLKRPILAGAACPIDQAEERRGAIFKAASDGTDKREGGRLSMDYHRE